jgi:circadian clock protein KaiB
MLTGGRGRIVLDLSAATFLDSSGLGTLLQCARRVREAQGAVALVIGSGSQPRARFDLTGTGQLLHVCESREEALALVQRAQGAGDADGRPPSTEKLSLRLYVNGRSSSAPRAIAALEDIRRRHLPDDSEVEIVDISEHPDRAERERLLAVPALVRVSPAPVRRIVGDLTDRDQVLYALDLHPGS